MDDRSSWLKPSFLPTAMEIEEMLRLCTRASSRSLVGLFALAREYETQVVFDIVERRRGDHFGRDFTPPFPALRP